MGLPPSPSEAPERPNNSSSKEHQPWSKPRTIIRMLSTKFNYCLPSSLPAPARLSPIPSSPNAYSKESRDAALRERGLLPPLKPNKDMSVQEKEQDRAIPIVLLSVDSHSPTQVDNLSAADLIKKEWEAKNRSLESSQLQGMNSFTFGITSIPKQLASVSDILAQPTCGNSLPSPQTLYSPLTFPLIPPSTVSPDASAYLCPLPPSPISPSFDLSLPALVPLPPSPLLGTSVCGTSRPSDIHEPSVVSTPISPIISLTPCEVVIPELPSTDDAAGSPLYKRTELFAPLDESASSTQTPSLDSNSYITTDSTLWTSESVMNSGKGKLGGLKIKTQEGSNIPVIVESPIEDSFLEEQDMDAKVTFDRNQEAATASAVSPITGNETKFSVKKRWLTDPTNNNMDRRKSVIMNPFKRGSSFNGDASDEAHRGLSVKESLSNMRRSVVGTLSRKSENSGAVVGRKAFDGSRLPASPILPLTLRSRTLPSIKTEGGDSPAVRRAVSPILYSPGHILMETSNIEDEETRRRTEMAFMT